MPISSFLVRGPFFGSKLVLRLYNNMDLLSNIQKIYIFLEFRMYQLSISLVCNLNMDYEYIKKWYWNARALEWRKTNEASWLSKHLEIDSLSDQIKNRTHLCMDMGNSCKLFNSWKRVSPNSTDSDVDFCYVLYFSIGLSL